MQYGEVQLETNKTVPTHLEPAITCITRTEESPRFVQVGLFNSINYIGLQTIQRSDAVIGAPNKRLPTFLHCINLNRRLNMAIQTNALTTHLGDPLWTELPYKAMNITICKIEPGEINIFIIFRYTDFTLSLHGGNSQSAVSAFPALETVTRRG